MKDDVRRDPESPIYEASLVYMRDVVYSYGIRQGLPELRAEMREPGSEYAPFAQHEKRAGWCDALIEAIQERSI